MRLAHVLWIFPLVLAGLGLHQLDVYRDLRETFVTGAQATARVTEFESSNRVDVTYDYVSLRVDLDGTIIERKRMSLPHSLAPIITGKEEIDVMVRPGADQEIVIAEVGRAHYRIAAINSAISILAALLLGVGVGWWNLYLRRRGDPAAQASSTL